MAEIKAILEPGRLKEQNRDSLGSVLLKADSQFITVWCYVCLTQVQQNIHVAVAEYAELKQKLEKNTIVITMLGHLKEVQHTQFKCQI